MNLRKPALFCCSVLLTFLAIPTLHATNLYWDSNDVNDGAGTNPDGIWDSSSFWSTDSLGQSPAGAWVNGSTAVFSAGTDAINNFTVTIGGTVSPAAVFVEEGVVTNFGGSINLTTSTEFSVTTNKATNIIISTITGAGGKIFKTGPGLLTLGTNNAQANTFDGGVIVAGGVLSFPGEGNSAATGTANPLGLHPATFQQANVIVSNNATLRSTKTGAGSSFVFTNRGITLGTGGGVLEVTSSAANDYLTVASKVTGAGSLTKIGSGVLYLTSTANNYTGPTTNKAGFLGIGTSYPYTKGNLYLQGGGLTAFGSTAPITNTFVMSANTTIKANSTLAAGSSRSMVFSNVWSITGGTLTMRNQSGTASLFTPRFFVGGWTNTRPTVIGNASDAGTLRLDFYNETNTPDIIFSGVISGPAGIRRSVNNDGNGGNLVLSGLNTYTGGTSNNGGFIGFGSSSSGGVDGAVTNGPIGTGPLTINDDSKVGFFAAGGPRVVGNTILFGNVMTNMYIGTNDLELSGSVTLNALSLIFNVTNTGTTKFSGPIGGGGNPLTKRGAGKLVFSGNNTFASPVVVEAGSLFADNTAGSGTGPSPVTVKPGATLGGNGIISGAISCQGNISPGDKVGTLTVGGGLDLSSGTYVWELGANDDTIASSADMISVTSGAIVLDGSSTLSINFVNSATAPNAVDSFWHSNHSWKVVSIDGGAGGGNFATLQNAAYPVGSFATSVDGSGNVFLNFTSTYVQAPSPTLSRAITGAGTTNTALSWSSVLNGAYQVQYKTNLNQTNWITLTTVTATGTTASFIDTNSPSTNRFYRILVP